MMRMAAASAAARSSISRHHSSHHCCCLYPDLCCRDEPETSRMFAVASFPCPSPDHGPFRGPYSGLGLAPCLCLGPLCLGSWSLVDPPVSGSDIAAAQAAGTTTDAW